MHANSETKIQSNYSPDTSLAQKACFTIVSTLWNQKNVSDCIKGNLLYIGPEYNWSEIENLVLVSLEKIFVPDTCKLNLKNVIQLMGVQILDWIAITKHSFLFYADHTVNLNLIWNDKGIFDHIRTAKFVLDHNSSNKFLCYSIACIFCIEEFISKPDVSVALPSFYFEQNDSLGTTENLVFVWCKMLSSTNDSFEVNSLGYSVAEQSMCVPVMKYFLERFPLQEKIMKIKSTLHLIYNKRKPQLGNALLLLFSYLHETEVKTLMCENAYATLSCLLQWPNQAFFMIAANATWNYLSKRQYLSLFSDLTKCLFKFHMSYIYTELLEEFWMSSPTVFKKCFIKNSVSGSSLGMLFFSENTDNLIQMIFDECTPEIRQQIIFYSFNMSICDYLVKNARWKSLKMFVLACISSRVVLEEFITQYQNFRQVYRTEEMIQNVPIFIEKVNEWY